MVSRRERWIWIAVTAVILAGSIPWFLWGDDRLWFGLPLWLWWHIGWLILAAVTFAVFTRRAWGAFITGGETA